MSERESSARLPGETREDASAPSSTNSQEVVSDAVPLVSTKTSKANADRPAVDEDQEPAPEQPKQQTNLRLKSTAPEAAPAAGQEKESQPPTPRRVDPDAPTKMALDDEEPAASSDGEAPSSKEARALIDQVLDGRYRIEALLGEGAMGLVYRARHEKIDKLVAVKVIRREMADDTEATGRFVMEAKAASAVGSPHIVTTLDFGNLPDGSTYFVMEYLEGRTLGSQVAGKALPIDRILRVGRQIAEGLEEAHGAGIVHRDLKPDNIFILQRGREKDFVKVLDFGIAKVAKAQAKLTRAGSIFGTPHYMSPEQASGMTVDHRTDIYSLGVILYEMSTGRVPFDAEGPMGILAQHIHNEPVPPSAVEGLSQPVPPALEAIILKCLSKQPDLRYQSMAEVAAELEKASGGIAPEALRELARRVTKQGRNIRRRVERRPLLAAAMALVLAVVLAAYAYANKPPEPPKMQSKVIRPPPGLSGALDFIGKIEDEASVPAPLDQSGHRSVAVIISPIDAHVLMGDENLGTMPVTIRIKENEKAWIRVVRDGYFQKNMSVDGSQSRVVVRLVPIPGSIPAVPAPGARILPGGVQVDVQDLLPRKPAPGSQPAAPASAPAAGASQMGEPPPPPKPAEPASSAKTVTPPSPPAEAHPAPQEKPVPPAAPAEQKPPAP